MLSRISVLLSFVFIMSGCSSFDALTDKEPLSPYKGFKKNVSTLVKGESVFFTFTLVDTPLSFVADTLLLPFSFNGQKDNDNSVEAGHPEKDSDKTQ